MSNDGLSQNAISPNTGNHAKRKVIASNMNNGSMPMRDANGVSSNRAVHLI